MPPLLAHHAGEQVLAPLLLLGSSGVTLLLAIGRARLAAAHAKLGLLVDRRLGNVRLLRAATDTPLSRPLTDLLAVTYGPLPVLSDELVAVPGVDRAFIYGSWAARYQGEPGPIPDDVDMLVVGTADQDDLDAVAQQAQRRLGRPVNIRRVRPASWRRPNPGDPFLASVHEPPLVELHLG